MKKNLAEKMNLTEEENTVINVVSEQKLRALYHVMEIVFFSWKS